MAIWSYILIASLGIFCLILLRISLKQKRRLNAMQTQFDIRLKSLENELGAMIDGSHGMGKVLQSVRKDLKANAVRQQKFEQRDLGNLPYNEAVNLAAHGATANDLVRQCGLSRSEAELVVMLNRKSPPIVVPEEDEGDRKYFYKPAMARNLSLVQRLDEDS